MTITAYPLAWPVGWKRTPTMQRRFAKFFKGEREYCETPGVPARMRQKAITLADSVQRTLAVLERWGVPRDDVVISTNVELRLDGFPRSNRPPPSDPGAAVYWRDCGSARCMAVDQYTTVEDNLAAIAATLAAMRLIERHGGAEILNRAFTGFTALPAPGGTTARGWREVLEVTPTETNLDVVKDRYRRLSAVRHPDKGGTQEGMSELNWAWAQAQQSLGARAA